MLEDLRRSLTAEEFDYQYLMSFLTDYKQPRNKINYLLKTGAIIRIKKGLYVFGERQRKGPVSLELLANLIYGPSYISLEYALGLHGMIPERVELITSVTLGKNKSFTTPLGNFTYEHLGENKYTVGAGLQPIDTKRNFLLASPEKALADVLFRRGKLAKEEELYEHLVSNLRIDEERLRGLRLTELTAIAQAYQSRTIDQLLALIRRLK